MHSASSQIFPLGQVPVVSNFDKDPAVATLAALGKLRRLTDQLLSSLGDVFDNSDHYGCVGCDTRLTRRELVLLEGQANELVIQCEREIFASYFIGKEAVLERINQCGKDVHILITRAVASS
ncbi:MAG: hypothetical protein IPJ67_04155 [Candidatus Moraniibacteriota bacterium]|nr:MAG: hypothetical protein IPJ67_04155 [Candidatus Moranbacteria bacterium]